MASTSKEHTPARCTSRKHTIPNYSKLLDYDEVADEDIALPPSPVKRKRPANLLQKLAITRQRIEQN